MFELLRSWIKPIIILTLVFFLALIVLEWGLDFAGSSRYSPNNTTVGSVNGESITPEMYNRTYQNLYNSQFRSNETEPNETQIARLKTQAWNQIVADVAVQQEAEKMGYKISPSDVYMYLRYSPPSWLQTTPTFQTDGKFDYQKYLNAMAEPGNAAIWASIEDAVQPEVRLAKVQEMITRGVMVTTPEVRQAFLNKNELAKFGILMVPTTGFQTPEELVMVTENQIIDYYEKHKYRFENDEMRAVDLVLISKEITEDDWQRIKAQAEEVSDSLKADTNFADWALAYSDDASAADGGDLGFIDIADLDSGYVKGAMSLKLGEVSAPVRSSFGWHIIKLKEMMDANGKITKDKDKATAIHTAHILFEVEASSETIEAAEKKARRFYQLAKSKGFESAATQLSLQVQKAGRFTKTGSIQYIGSDFFAAEWAFNSEIGDISGIYDNASNYFIMKLTEVVPAGPIALENIRASVENMIRTEKLREMCKDTVLAIRNDVMGGMSLKDAANAHPIAQYLETTKISRSSSLPTPIGKDPKAIGAAFSLNAVGEISQPEVIDRGAALFELLEKESPGLDVFNQVRDSVRSQLLGQKANEVWQNWYTMVVQKAVAENYQERQIAEARANADTTAMY